MKKVTQQNPKINQLVTQMKTEKWFFMRYLLSAIWRLYFYPAKFDNFKDEKKQTEKTVSFPQSKKLLELKLLV